MPSKLSFIVDGKKIDQWSMDPDVDYESFLDTKTNVIWSFSDPKDFIKWAKNADVTMDIQGSIKKRNDAKALYGEMSDQKKISLESQQTAAFVKKQSTVRALLRKAGVRANDQAGLLKLHKAGEIGSMVVYNFRNCAGTWAYFLPVPYPNLRWFSWNDRISSFTNFGLYASMHQLTWFRGSTLWVPPSARYTDLGWYNNRISSIGFYL